MESKKPVAEIEVTDREFTKLVVTRNVILKGRKGEKGKVFFTEGDIMSVICRSSQIEPPRVKVVNTENNELRKELTDIEVELLR